MLWRFAPMADPLVQEFHSRDLDSTVSQREVDAVNDWIETKYSFHIMRDNPYHRATILGGMFGIKLTSISLKVRIHKIIHLIVKAIIVSEQNHGSLPENDSRINVIQDWKGLRSGNAGQVSLAAGKK